MLKEFKQKWVRQSTGCLVQKASLSVFGNLTTNGISGCDLDIHPSENSHLSKSSRQADQVPYSAPWY